jgi:hypothetical protein
MKPRESGSSGLYWVTTLPDGEHAVMWTQIAFPKWHQQVATFAARARAENYAEMENEGHATGVRLPDEQAAPPNALPATLVPPGVTTSVAPTPAFQVFPTPVKLRGEALVERIKAELPDLFEIFPHGVTARDIGERYSAAYHDVAAALRYLDASKLARWVSPNAGVRKLLLPIESEVREPDLTAIQETVLKALVTAKDKNDLVNLTPLELSHLSMVNKVSLTPALGTLERKGYIMLAKPGGPKSPPTYQVLIAEPRPPAES